MSKKRYKVIGSQPVLGHLPGETFEANIPEDQEAFLKQIGGIRAVGGTPPSDPTAGVDAAAERLTEEQETAKRTDTTT
jgi:hypothetical protein